MHYMPHRSHRMRKHKFGVACLNALLVESISVTSEHEKECVDVSRPRRTEMHYVTHRSHRMQKHKFDITCPKADGNL
jgi:hypothetical protein